MIPIGKRESAKELLKGKVGQDIETEIEFQAELTDQSSYLTPGTNNLRKGSNAEEMEKVLVNKRALGTRRGGNRKLEEGSFADEGRGLSSGIRDVRGLMRSLKDLTMNIELMMRRITASNKGDPMLEKLNTESVTETKRVRRWINANPETNLDLATGKPWLRR